ncbi:cellulose binding domain-containing protein [Micromonospora gifhornensis]|uniref:cellulose binding domain-containing protein n=1 Tax=Micromonospora gifhornensis TaxID=84594 RepID=UPI003D73BE55
MAVRPVGDESGEPTSRRIVPNVIASAPWVATLVGVAVLALLLVVAMLSFREPEQPAAWSPGPPLVLPQQESTPTTTPTRGSGPTATPTTVPTRSAPTRSATSGPSVPPSPNASSARAADEPSASAAPTAKPSTFLDLGGVEATYQVMTSHPGSFQAELVISNDTAGAVGWVVDLRFTSEVTGVRASSGPGVSVGIKGAGWYVLSGTGQLAAEAQQTVRLRVSRTGGGEYPAQCTVNGSVCALS